MTRNTSKHAPKDALIAEIFFSPNTFLQDKLIKQIKFIEPLYNVLNNSIGSHQII